MTVVKAYYLRAEALAPDQKVTAIRTVRVLIFSWYVAHVNVL